MQKIFVFGMRGFLRSLQTKSDSVFTIAIMTLHVEEEWNMSGGNRDSSSGDDDFGFDVVTGQKAGGSDAHGAPNYTLTGAAPVEAEKVISNVVSPEGVFSPEGEGRSGDRPVPRRSQTKTGFFSGVRPPYRGS